ncbi:hypothetical protein GCM10028805_36620 [Spirosoma harenae]
MAGSVNIRLGVTVTDFVNGFNVARQTTQGFHKQFTSDFKSISDLTKNATANIGNITSGLKTPNKDIDALIGKFGVLNKSALGLGSLTSTFGGLFAADKVLSFGQAITTTSGQFEKYFATLKTGLQSQAGANDNLGLLTSFAADTPNSLDELTGSFIKFVNRGLIPTRQQLTNFGDLAASQGKGFDQLTEAVLDAQTGEFERLKEFGVTASKSGDQVSLSFKGVTQTVKNTSSEITDAILKFGQMNGVAGSMAAVSQTLEGKLSNLGDMFDRLLVALGDGGVSGAFKEAIDLSSRFLGVVTDLIAKSPVEDLRSQQTELNGLVGAIALANDNEAVRLNLVTQLNQKYPEFLGQLNAESINTELLTTRLAAANEQYEKKIRIALGQQAIKRSTEDVTKAIQDQSNALQQLSRASGKSLTDLEKLSSAQRIDLARKLAAAQPKVNLGMGVYGPNPLSAVATVLEEAGKRQKAAQTELNQLTKENSTRQADLTKTTVDGYQAQIAQIREKIRLHQIDVKLGEAEIKRLSDQSLIAQGKTPPVVPIKPPIITKGNSGAMLDPGNLAIFKRYADQLKKQIEELGENSPQLAEKQQALASINDQIERLNFLTSGKDRVDIGGLKQLINPDTDKRVADIVANIFKLKAATPELFTKTGLEQVLSQIDQAKPSIEYYRNKIAEINALITQMSLSGLKVPPEVLDQLKKLKQLMADAEGATSAANALTNPGLTASDQGKWITKAQARIEEMKAGGQLVKQSAEEMAATMQQAHDTLVNAGASVLSGIGEGLAKGENPLKVALKSILSILGDYLVQLGTALLLSSSILLASAPLTFGITLAPGIGQKIAGGLLIVGGGLVKGFGGSFEGGGLFKGESFIRVGESAKALRGGGEAVFPVGMGIDLITEGIIGNLSKLTTTPKVNTPSYRDMQFRPQVQQVVHSGELVARGNDLVYVFGQTNYSNSTL